MRAARLTSDHRHVRETTTRRHTAVVRPTNDVDIVLHIETSRGIPDATAEVLEKFGYKIKDNIDRRNNVGHRFTRGTTHIDVVVADHPAPRVEEKMRSRDMVKIEGGTQALKRTANYRLAIAKGQHIIISVPRPFGALILKAAAYKADNRDRDPAPSRRRRPPCLRRGPGRGTRRIGRQ